MAGPVITIAVLADTEKARRELKETGDAADSMGKGFSVSAGKVAAAAAGIAAGGAAVSFLTSSVKDAAEDDSQQRLYEAQLKNAGASDEIIESFNKQITAGQKLKGFTDTDLRVAYSQFYQQSRSVEQSQKDVALAMDIARASGGTLEQATDAITKAHEGNSKSLAALLPQYTDLIKNSDDSAVVFSTLTTAVQGQADVFANSSAGQLERANQQYGEMKEAIGAKLLPVVASLATFLSTKLVPAVGQATDFVKDNRIYFEAAGIAIVAILLPALVGWAIAAGAAAVATIAAAAPVIALGIVIGGLVLGVMELVRHWGDVTNFLHDLVSWENIKRVIAAVATGGLSEVARHFGLVDAVAGPIMAGIHAAIDGISGAVDWLLTQLGKAKSAIENLPGAGVVRGIGGAVGGIGGAIGGLFADGGVVPGSRGQPVGIIAHAGEIVLNPRQQAALLTGGAGGGTTIINYPNGYRTPGQVRDAQRRYDRRNGV